MKYVLILVISFLIKEAQAKTITVIATSYCACKICCGSAAKGITATGVKVKVGIIAVDPKIIPLHSKVTIDKKIYYAEDTGSAIKGKRIDIFMSTHEEAKKFGRKKLTVTF